MKATLSFPLADLPGLPIAKRGNAVLAAIPAVVRTKVLRFMGAPVLGKDFAIESDGIRNTLTRRVSFEVAQSLSLAAQHFCLRANGPAVYLAQPEGLGR